MFQICLALSVIGIFILIINFMLLYKMQREVNTVLMLRVKELEKALSRAGIEVDPIAETLPAGANIQPQAVGAAVAKLLH